MKHCTCCGETKPLDSFHQDKRKPDGRVSRCKPCKAAQDKERYAAEGDQLREAARIRSRERYQNDPAYADRVREVSRTVAQANPNANRARVAAWRAANPERHRKNARRWQQENPGKAAEIGARKRAAKGKAVALWADHAAISRIYDDARALREMGADVQVDHIIPLQGTHVCGLHVENNLRLLPARVNAAKGNRHETC